MLKLRMGLAVAVVAALGLTLGAGAPGGAKKQKETRVFELRTYYAAPGKMEALHARFRNHTCKLFEKHGMKLVGFWVPTDAKGGPEKLIYILAFPSRAAADRSWEAFKADPDWQRAKTASEKDGKLVAKFESTYLNPTDYSPIK